GAGRGAPLCGPRPRVFRAFVLGRVARGEGPRSRAASRPAPADRPVLAFAGRGRGPAGRFPPVPGRDEAALPGPWRPLDRRPPVARSPLVRARDGESPGAGVRPVVSPRGGPRRHLHPRWPVRALPRALSRAPAAVVPRRGSRRDARAPSGCVVRVLGWPHVDPRDVDAVIQSVRFELYRENIYGALEIVEAARAEHSDPRYAERTARIRSVRTP